MRDAAGAENGDAEGIDWVGNGKGLPQPTRGLGERRKFPQRGSGAELRPRTILMF